MQVSGFTVWGSTITWQLRKSRRLTSSCRARNKSPLNLKKHSTSDPAICLQAWRKTNTTAWGSHYHHSRLHPILIDGPLYSGPSRQCGLLNPRDGDLHQNPKTQKKRKHAAAKKEYTRLTKFTRSPICTHPNGNTLKPFFMYSLSIKQ